MTMTASLDCFALCGGAHFFRGSSLWGGKKGMVGQIRQTLLGPQLYFKKYEQSGSFERCVRCI